VDRTQELTPDAAGVHVSLGILEHYYGWNPVREERELRLAIERGGHEGYNWLTLCLGATGRVEEAVEIGRRSVEAEPHSANARAALGWAYFPSRRFSEAVPQFEKAVALDPDAVFGLWSLGMAQQQIGDAAGAVATLERAVQITEREHMYEMALLVDALAAAGREGQARAIRAELTERARSSYVPPVDLALASVALGDREAALSELERAFDERNALLWFRIHLSSFDPLRNEPRWKAVAEKLARSAPLHLGIGD
jgi:tetratricopeptide (TPR) repeat protein